MLNFLQENFLNLLLKIGEHLYISMIALFLGVLFAVPLGILITRTKSLADFIIGIVSVLQTVPSLALLAIMISFFGVGKPPAIAALFIYSLLPVLRNTYLGINGVDPELKDAAKGMGMTSFQSLYKVELPLGLPIIMAGIRLSAVYVISWATLASYIGAGGLGDYIFNGLNNYIPEMIVIGTIPVTLLALLVDFLFGKVEERLSPKQIKNQEKS